jgi:hypothetical protein
MASSPVFHPSVQTRAEPRVSAAALAEYLILRPDGQQKILHDSKYSRPPIISANGEAMRALRAYIRGACEQIRTLWASVTPKPALFKKP